MLCYARSVGRNESLVAQLADLLVSLRIENQKLLQIQSLKHTESQGRR